MQLYKYRGLSNLQYALDIFTNCRLHAAKFTELNDPMEGTYTYEPDQLGAQEIEDILRGKNSYRILSLTANPSNMLMWTHYAEAHAGMVVGVDVVDVKAEVKAVEYVDDLAIDTNHPNVPLGILVKKHKLWSYEEERRAFIQDEDFVKVEVRHLIFGLHTNPQTKELVQTVAQKFCPEITIRTIEYTEIEPRK